MWGNHVRQACDKAAVFKSYVAAWCVQPQTHRPLYLYYLLVLISFSYCHKRSVVLFGLRNLFTTKPIIRKGFRLYLTLDEMPCSSSPQPHTEIAVGFSLIRTTNTQKLQQNQNGSPKVDPNPSHTSTFLLPLFHLPSDRIILGIRSFIIYQNGKWQPVTVVIQYREKKTCKTFSEVWDEGYQKTPAVRYKYGEYVVEMKWPFHFLRRIITDCQAASREGFMILPLNEEEMQTVFIKRKYVGWLEEVAKCH